MIQDADDLTDTNRQYQSDFAIFTRWCKHKGIGYDSTVNHVDVINFLADQFSGVLTSHDKHTDTLINGNMIAASTLDRRRWGIVAVLKSKGIHLTALELEAISKYIRLLKMQTDQTKPAASRGQSAPLRWIDIEKMMYCPSLMRKSKFVQLRDRAMLAFSAVTGSRESELLGDFGTRLQDFTFLENRIDYRRMVLKLGKRSYSFSGAVAKGTNSKTCPYTVIQQYHEFVSKLRYSKPDTKLFIRSTNQGKPFFSKANRQYAPFGPRSFDNLLRDYAISAGLGYEFAQHVSGHSIRMGLVVGQTENGMTFEQISQVTGQSVATVERYAVQARKSPFNAE